MSPDRFVLRTQAKDGTEHTFSVMEEPRDDGRGWDYRILSNRPDGDPFDMSVVVVEPGLLQVDMVNHNLNPEFRGKGIPEALYVAVARNRNCTLRSSPTRRDPATTDEGVWMTEAGVAVWKRLEARGDAKFDQPSGRWVLPCPRL